MPSRLPTFTLGVRLALFGSHPDPVAAPERTATSHPRPLRGHGIPLRAFLSHILRPGLHRPRAEGDSAGPAHHRRRHGADPWRILAGIRAIRNPQRLDRRPLWGPANAHAH